MCATHKLDGMVSQGLQSSACLVITCAVCAQAQALAVRARVQSSSLAGQSIQAMRGVPQTRWKLRVLLPTRYTSAQVMVKKTCAAPGCARQPSFNLPGSKGPCTASNMPRLTWCACVLCAQPGCTLHLFLMPAAPLACVHANRRLSFGDSVPALRGAPEQVSGRKRAASASAAKNQQYPAS